MTINTNFDGREMGQSTLIVDCPHNGDTNYSTSTGIDISSLDWEALTKPIHSLELTAGTGNIHVMLEGGGRKILPFTVDDGDCRTVLSGQRIIRIYNKATGSTTFTGYIFPNY
jgi:hypothetical protein